MSLHNVQAELAELITKLHAETNTIVPSENILIYRNNTISTLIKTLQNTYPMIEKLLGKDFFYLTAKEYIKQYPSRSSNLNEYGEYFNSFLANYAPVRNLIYLVEVAEFEWISHTLHFTADHPGLDFQRLEKVPTDAYEELRFNLHPSTKVMKFHYPILAIVELCQHNPKKEIDLNAGGINLLLTRRDFDILYIPLEETDFVFLHGLQEGQVLKTALQKALEYTSDFKLEEKLKSWIQDKTIVDFT